ncbi:hypothetical protein FIBSPDRAFT_1043997 [Athelia psychrophila]|uniref:DUF6534 domain-containing protein n=1 Tax=Athelia psychrophila TaxID=1759441 RepID=A0A166KAM0_9AGAM|nr:hypothetical protein FIBSPDRAFT_1043997 [Fibularhizoctonia sp. CBS 109695]
MSSSLALRETLGALLIGVTISVALYGVLCCQTLMYVRRYTKDPIMLKSLVSAIWFLETVHTAMVGYAAYYYTISHRGDLDMAQKPTWMTMLEMIPASMVVFLTQYVWIMRIWTLNRYSWRTPMAFGMLSLLGIDGCFSTAWLATNYHDEKWGDVGVRHEWLMLTSVALIAVSDAWSTIMLIWTLGRKRLGIRSGDALVTRVITYGLNTGLLTIFGSGIVVVLLGLMPSSLYYMGAYVTFSKVYANSLLAMLNWRRSTSDKDEGEASEAFSLDTVPWGPWATATANASVYAEPCD